MDRLADRAQALLDDGRAACSSPATSTSARPTTTTHPARCRRPTPWCARKAGRAFRRMLWLGLTDAIRAIHPHGRDLYLLGLSGRRLAARYRPAHRPRPAVSQPWPNGSAAADPDKHERDQPQPSDHVPVIIGLHSPGRRAQSACYSQCAGRQIQRPSRGAQTQRPSDVVPVMRPPLDVMAADPDVADTIPVPVPRFHTRSPRGRRHEPPARGGGIGGVARRWRLRDRGALPISDKTPASGGAKRFMRPLPVTSTSAMS